MKEGTDADLHAYAVACAHAKQVNVKNKEGDSVVEVTSEVLGPGLVVSPCLDDTSEGLMV